MRAYAPRGPVAVRPAGCHLNFLENMNNWIAFDRGKYQKFLCGKNIPWISFGKDLVHFSPAMEKKMEMEMDEISGSGGNVIRWWLHTDGSHSPEISGGKVVGIHGETISIIRKILDMAKDRGLAVILCLWSFDMLKHQGQDILAMKNILEEPDFTRAYIDHALLPILDGIGDHRAVATWEIFNEAEGMSLEFGWSDTRTAIKNIQRTINLIAGAIHRHGNGIPVSSSAWSMRTLSDIGDYSNYYRDDRLFDEGKDPDGFLDLYQVHFYPEHFDNALSPFHNPYSFWKLDKPLLISEFPETGCSRGRTVPAKGIYESFEYALQSGYAGCLTWRKGNAGFFMVEVKPAIQSLKAKYEEAISVMY